MFDVIDVFEPIVEQNAQVTVDSRPISGRWLSPLAVRRSFPTFARTRQPMAYPNVLRNIGLAILLILLLGAILLRDPPQGWAASGAETDASSGPFESSTGDAEDGNGSETVDSSDSSRDLETDLAANNESEPAAQSAATETGTGQSYGWRAVLSTWQFWLLYAMFVAISGADLLLVAQVVDFAEQLGFTAVIATISATVLPLASGGSRIVLGAISDAFRRKYVMSISFLLAGVFRLLLVYTGLAGSEALFVVLVMLAMFFSSPLYVFFPSILSDYYGPQYSSENYALLYTAKIGCGLFSGVFAGALVAWTGWATTFVIGGLIALAAGVAALALEPPSLAG